jgi:hypothetical protein
MSSFAGRTSPSTSPSTSASTTPWTARSTASRSSAARTRVPLPPRAAASSSSLAADDLCALEREWRAVGYDLNARWALMKRLWTLEASRAGLSLDEWNLGWHSAKSYVGITYMYDDRGDIFVSKYLCLDPEFDNAVGCLRHELAHAVAGPTSADHGTGFRAACETLDVPAAWRSATTGAFYSRPAVQMMWAKHDVQETLRGGKFATLPELLYEKTIWSAPVNGERTVYTDDETNTTIDAFQMYALVCAAEEEEAQRQNASS